MSLVQNPINWKELELLIQQISPLCESLFVERVIVPLRKNFPTPYFKGEWFIRLTSKKQEFGLLMSIRPRHPYIAWVDNKGPQASLEATRSPFDLTLAKQLKGAKLLKCQTLERERVAIFWFTDEAHSENRTGLVLVLIPAAPEAFLIAASSLSLQGPPPPTGWPILSRSRTVRDPKKIQTHYIPPQGHQAPLNPQVRLELLSSPSALSELIQKELETEAFNLRLQNVKKLLHHATHQLKARLRQSQTARIEAEKEDDWQRMGDLLKGSLGFPEVQMTHLKCDPQLSLKEQMEKFYRNAKRKQRRILEAQSRISRFQEKLAYLESHTEKLDRNEILPGEFKILVSLEQILLPTHSGSHSSASPKSKGKSAWLGKSFLSQGGQTILVGRNKDENLELTFKHARGNDLWMHVRAKPGAHALIPLQPGKSAALETLLDAATLVIHYSGGQNWGKTEIDYTFKKFVKRMKAPSRRNGKTTDEVIYTHNKTLMVQPDPERIKRLLSQDHSLNEVS